ncbi:MAG: glutaredoxin family protein [Sterolibacterium sp.]|nr:glutaredoxin family protein [Sterolibacterium sp.]
MRNWPIKFPPRLVRLACLALMLMMAFASQAQTAYRWVDKNGKVHYSDQPPPPAETREVQQKKLKSGNVIETGGPSFDALQAAQKFPLTLYTSANCVENCKIARDFLARRGAAYAEKVLKTLEDAEEFRKATGSQELIVPVLQAGNKSEKGFEENAWRNLLDAAGYPPGSGKTSPKPQGN